MIRPTVGARATPARRSRPSHAGLRTVAAVVTATAVSLVSLLWASTVAGEEVERRALAGLASTAKATVLQEQQAWDGAVRIAVSAAARPFALSALQSGDAALAGTGVENVLVTGPFAVVRLYGRGGDLLATAAIPGVTPTPVDGNAPSRVIVGEPAGVGTRTARQVSVPVGADLGRLVVDVDMTQLLGKPSDLGFDRTGAKFLVTRDGLIVAGSTSVGTHLLSPVNLAIVAAGEPVTTQVYSPLFGRMTVESFEPIPDQGVGILLQQARSEVMAGADNLSELLHWVALAVGLLGAAVAVSLGLLVGRRGRRLAATERRLVEHAEEMQRAEDAQARLASIVQASADAILANTLDGIVTSGNPGAEVLFGYDAGAMIGSTIDGLIPPDRRAEETEMRCRVAGGVAGRRPAHCASKWPTMASGYRRPTSAGCSAPSSRSTRPRPAGTAARASAWPSAASWSK